MEHRREPLVQSLPCAQRVAYPFNAHMACYETHRDLDRFSGWWTITHQTPVLGAVPFVSARSPVFGTVPILHMSFGLESNSTRGQSPLGLLTLPTAHHAVLRLIHSLISLHYSVALRPFFFEPANDEETCRDTYNNSNEKQNMSNSELYTVDYNVHSATSATRSYDRTQIMHHAHNISVILSNCPIQRDSRYNTRNYNGKMQASAKLCTSPFTRPLLVETVISCLWHGF